jgi:anti-sigma regulatory factor (Ser/Thr protein kinase)
MLRHNMTVVTKDNRLKREVQRVTAATASNAEFVLDPLAIDRVRSPDLVIYDARTEAPTKEFRDKLPATCSVIYIVDEENPMVGIDLLQDPRATSVMGHGARFDDDEFIASATKALRGNIFGLSKYFPWGVTTFSVVVKSGADKTKAIDIILRYATLAGVRGPVRDRIQTVADELMMNGLYHAPVDAEGKELYRNRPFKELSQEPELQPIEVQYGSSGRYFGISVRDGGGSLDRTRAMRYLAKAKTATADIEHKVGGAGLGLVSVLRSVSKLVFNLQPGTSTEVVGLFDMELLAKGKVGARSIHIFTAQAQPEPEPEADDAEADAKAPPPPAAAAPQSYGMWILAAILLSVVTALGTAAILR